MASVDPTLLTVKVKSPDPRNSTNDRKSLPRADLRNSESWRGQSTDKISHCIGSRALLTGLSFRPALDETQQYLRRDCLEINGVPISSYENPNQLVKEVGLLAGVEIDDRHIAAAHKLPDSKNVKYRLIVKFIQRDKREELYKHRKNLVGKNISHLPSVEDGNGKIFINESLTSYRKRLFGRIREYKRNNNLKYLWTSNGKIMLKVNDTSPTQAFVTHEQFEDYLDQISNH
ncbi:uncharacterized protein [Montipora foliosa]|uniref:uncharacterized protein n=1 Tax=Montipora foliosa TaxID=591990 RepID=UPI0035F1144E